MPNHCKKYRCWLTLQHDHQYGNTIRGYALQSKDGLIDLTSQEDLIKSHVVVGYPPQGFCHRTLLMPLYL